MMEPEELRSLVEGEKALNSDEKKQKTREEFKKLWEADEHGSGITFDDIADRAKEWGLFDHPKRCDINIVRYEVLKAAKCVDTEEFNPYKN